MRKKAVGWAFFCNFENVQYISGYEPPFESDPILIVIGLDTEPVMIAPETQKEAIEGQSWIDDRRYYLNYSITEEVDVDSAVASIVSDVINEFSAGGPVIGIEEGSLPLALFLKLREKLGKIEHRDVSSICAQMRAVKDQFEIEAIADTARLCDLGQKVAREIIKEGLSEIEVFAQIRAAMETGAERRIFMAGDLACGEGNETGEGWPGGRRIKKNDLVIIDLVASYRGYWADTTRVVAAGAPAGKIEEIFKLVLEAKERGIAAIKPGVEAAEIDDTVRSVIKKAGYDYPHHTGHGLGLSHFESPLIVPGNHTALEQGMVLTIEPGVYLRGVGGVRLEETVLITDRGAQPLSQYKNIL